MSDAAKEALLSWEQHPKTAEEHAVELAAALRDEMKRWAKARGEAVDLAVERDVLLSIVQDLAARHPGFDTHTSCLFCADAVEDHTCLWVRARAFLVSRESPEGEPK